MDVAWNVSERIQSGRLASCSPACCNAVFQPRGLTSSQRQQRQATAAAARGGKRGKQPSGRAKGSPAGQLLEVQPDASDAWRLTEVTTSLQSGGVAIIPTDTLPAFVCDVSDSSAVERLYYMKEMSTSQPLSILCRSWTDISTYTLGFPAANGPGQRDTYRLARQLLPGAYTLILLASKALPKQCVDYMSGKSKVRRTVGVRLVEDPVCQAVLQQLDRPLLCSSIRPLDVLSGALDDGAVLLDQYAPRGLDYVVDNGVRYGEGSSVVDMTVNPPQVLRSGAGDVSMFELEETSLVPS